MRIHRIAGATAALAGVGLVGLAALFLLSTYRRIETRLQVAAGALITEGVVTEKLAASVEDRFLPFEVRTHIIRYAFVNPEGQMRIGEQEVTASFAAQAPAPGGPIPVIISEHNPAVSAVDAGVGFPGAAAWRLAIGLAALTAGGLLLGGGARLIVRRG
ncbi:MAG: hypothetical protein Kow00124_02100 [Anaerolineae bacterium]